MKRQFLVVTALAWGLAGCSKPPAAETAKTAESPAAKAPDYFKVDPSTAGDIKGVVRFTGKPPGAAKIISMDAEAECQKLHATPVRDEAIVLGKDKGLANAFVYVKAGLEGKTFEPPKEAVVLEQRGCQFIPRVLALRTGQVLAVKNSDPVSHNVHPMPKNNRDWNQQQPPKAEDLKRKFGFSEVMIPVKCNIHAWMRSFIGVLDHPYFAVTDDDGAFSLKGLPPGKYTVAVWHEKLGEQTSEVNVAKGETASDFSFR
jgi:plastocyanin